jgi:ribosomal protein S18 acetylase RimI-like enzyme
MPLTVRAATPADLPAIVEYNRRLALETEHKTLDPDVVAAGVAAALADPQSKGPYFLTCDGTDVIGQLQVTYEWSDWRNGWFWWIQSVYVRADGRGRGAFRALYEHVRTRAKAAKNVVGIRLYVERDNVAAQGTYARIGMTRMPYLMLEEAIAPNYQLPP